MKKITIQLSLGLALLLFSGQVIGQTNTKNASGVNFTSAAKNGVNVLVHSSNNPGAASNTKIDFVNTTTENIVFTWSIVDKTGKTLYTSQPVELKSGAAFSYQNASNASLTELTKGISAEEIGITLKN